MRERIQDRYTVPDTRTDYSFKHYFQSVLCSRHSDARNISQGESLLNLISIILNMVLI